MAVSAHELIRSVVEKSGADGLANLPAIAVTAELLPGYAADRQALMERSMVVRVLPHPVLTALMETAGAYRPSAKSLSWSIGAGEQSDTAGFEVLLDALIPGVVFPEALTANSKGPRDLNTINGHEKLTGLRNHLTGTSAWRVLNGRRETAVRAPLPGAFANKAGIVAVQAAGTSLWFKVYTNHELLSEYGEFGRILNQRPAGKDVIEPKPMRPYEAIAVLEWAAKHGLTVTDASEHRDVATLRRLLATSVVAHAAPGRPYRATVVLGSKLSDEAFSRIGVARPGPGSAASSAVETSAEAVLGATADMADENVAVHAQVLDVGRMAVAPAFEDERLDKFPYQGEVIGRHLVTQFGYVNAIDKGMGKTICSLLGMRGRAAHIPGYRSLVVVEANVRTQWAKAAEDWFPEANVITVRTSAEADKLEDGLAEAGDTPVVVITSYPLASTVNAALARRDEQRRLDAAENARAEIAAQRKSISTMLAQVTAIDGEKSATELLGDLVLAASQKEKPKKGKKAKGKKLTVSDEDVPMLDLDGQVTADATPDTGTAKASRKKKVEKAPASLGDLLLDTFWHDLIADEATVLRSTGKQATAMWVLRENSAVAVALTGTPYATSLDDVARLIAWTRNDRHMFDGAKLDQQFDKDNVEELRKFYEIVGPLLFRRSSSELGGLLPKPEPHVIPLEPRMAERNLANAGRSELKRVYEELLEWITRVEETDADNPAYAAAREELTRARGACLSGTTLARMAASDPASLLSSESAGAALLAAQGFIAAATDQIGTKRAWAISTCVEEAAKGEKILIFTDFATVAEGLIESLRESGLRVGAVLGTNLRERDSQIVAFQAGQLDVMVLTKAGEKGLNLQRATMVIHYDLPWTPASITQRTGRAIRIGSTAKVVKILFPVMTGTIEERIVAVVADRAIRAMLALDAARGIDIRDTEMGLALSGLVGLADAVGATEARNGETGMLDIMREVLAA